MIRIVNENEFRSVWSVQDSDINEWKSICRKYCKDNGYELLFVNNESFGFEKPNGQMVHMYMDELIDILNK